MSGYKLYRPKKRIEGVAPRVRLSEENLDLIGIPREFWGMKLDELRDSNEAVVEVVAKYVHTLHKQYQQGNGLYLYGSNGVGKTALASIVCREAYRHRYTAKFATMNTITPIGSKAGWDEDVKAVYYGDYMNIDFLVIDEVGKEQEGQSRANVTVLEEVLRHRNARKLPTVMITNLDASDFRERYGESIYSLIFARFVDIKISGEDKRKTVAHKRVLDLLKEE